MDSKMDSKVNSKMNSKMDSVNLSIKRGFSSVKQCNDKTKFIYRNEHGFSMIEIVIAFALAAVLLLGVTTTSTLTHNNTSTMHGILYRDEVVRQIQQLSSTPQTLQVTLAYTSNTALRACVSPPSGAGPNPGCTHGLEYPVVLTDMAGAQVTGVMPADAVTGVATYSVTNENQAGNPLYYSVLDGSLCRSGGVPITAPTTICALEALTSFVPSCSDASNNCRDPLRIAITFQYRVRLTSVALNPKPMGGAQLKSVIAPPAPLSYVNAKSIQLGYFTN
jgi:type II secretory pathway pseudopilin PulG